MTVSLSVCVCDCQQALYGQVGPFQALLTLNYLILILGFCVLFSVSGVFVGFICCAVFNNHLILFFYIYIYLLYAFKCFFFL